MNPLDILKKIGGGVETGLDYIAQAKMAHKLQQQLGPDWREILEHEAWQRRNERDMAPVEHRAKEADIDYTVTQTNKAQAQEGREAELHPGVVKSQGLGIEQQETDLGLSKGDLEFQPTAQQMDVNRALMGPPQAGVGIDPDTLTLNTGDLTGLTERTQERGELSNEYTKALIMQAFRNATQKGYNISFSQIAQLAKDLLVNPITGQPSNLSEKEFADQIDARIRNVLAAQQRLEAETVK
jgi:hypothetical protein